MIYSIKYIIIHIILSYIIIYYILYIIYNMYTYYNIIHTYNVCPMYNIFTHSVIYGNIYAPYIVLPIVYSYFIFVTPYIKVTPCSVQLDDKQYNNNLTALYISKLRLFEWTGVRHTEISLFD